MRIIATLCILLFVSCDSGNQSAKDEKVEFMEKFTAELNGKNLKFVQDHSSNRSFQWFKKNTNNFTNLKLIGLSRYPEGPYNFVLKSQDTFVCNVANSAGGAYLIVKSADIFLITDVVPLE
jgi:hypothetical protein